MNNKIRLPRLYSLTIVNGDSRGLGSIPRDTGQKEHEILSSIDGEVHFTCVMKWEGQRRPGTWNTLIKAGQKTMSAPLDYKGERTIQIVRVDVPWTVGDQLKLQFWLEDTLLVERSIPIRKARHVEL